MSYMNTFNGLCGDQQFDFETIMKDYLISYLLEWNPRWDPSRTNQKCPLWTPFEKNSPELDCAIKDKNKPFADGHSDGIIPTAAAPTVCVTADNLDVACSSLEQTFPHLNKDNILLEITETIPTLTTGATAGTGASAWQRETFLFLISKDKVWLSKICL